MHISVRGFYHMGTMQSHWPVVFRDQIRLMNGQHRDVDCDIRNCSEFYRNVWRSGNNNVGLLNIIDKLEIHVNELVKGPRHHPDVNVSSILDSMDLSNRQKIQVSHARGLSRDQYASAFNANNSIYG